MVKTVWSKTQDIEKEHSSDGKATNQMDCKHRIHRQPNVVTSKRRDHLRPRLPGNQTHVFFYMFLSPRTMCFKKKHERKINAMKNTHHRCEISRNFACSGSNARHALASSKDLCQSPKPSRQSFAPALPLDPAGIVTI